MDPITHEMARIRQVEIQARPHRRPTHDHLRDYRTGNGILRIIRLGRR